MIATFIYSYHNQISLPNQSANPYLGYNTANTRQASNYRSSPCRTNIKQFTILQQRPKTWNPLPHDLISAPTIATFTRSLKQYLIVQRAEY